MFYCCISTVLCGLGKCVCDPRVVRSSVYVPVSVCGNVNVFVSVRVSLLIRWPESSRGGNLKKRVARYCVCVCVCVYGRSVCVCIYMIHKEVKHRCVRWERQDTMIGSEVNVEAACVH